ncbi:YfmN [Bacillus sp. JS]|nr:YfmN [Bacillus sp. JS]GFM12170.1 YfmN [Bacillus sp. FW1]
MTQFYYLTAKIPLETGFFGQQERRSRKGHPLRSGIDAAGIYLVGAENVSVHLQLPFQVMVHAVEGTFAMKAKPDEYEQKCLETLYQYIHSVMKNSFSVEWFTAWADEEDFELSAKRELTLDECTSPLQLILKDRELLRIVQKKWQ